MSAELNPVIVSGAREFPAPGRFVQFWAPVVFAPDVEVMQCVASMGDGPALWLRVIESCPVELIDMVFDAFRLFRDGRPVAATHTIVRNCGQEPYFEPIVPPEPAADELPLFEVTD